MEEKRALWGGGVVVQGPESICRGLADPCLRAVERLKGAPWRVCTGQRLEGCAEATSNYELGLLETSLSTASPARLWPCPVPRTVPDVCRCGATGLMWGFLTWVCGSNRGWSISLARHLSRTRVPHPQHWASLRGSLPHAEGTITDQISWGGRRALGQEMVDTGRDSELWKLARLGGILILRTCGT